MGPRALRLALEEATARDVSPEAVGLVLGWYGLTVADIRSDLPVNVSSSTVDVIRRNLSVCSSIGPPLATTSPLDLLSSGSTIELLVNRVCVVCTRALTGRPSDYATCSPACRREASRFRAVLSGEGDGPLARGRTAAQPGP